MPFNETIKQLTTQTRNHASNFNEVNNKLLENTIYNKEQLELLKTQVDGLETIEWEEVAGKPTTFPAEEHRHNVSEIDGLDNVGGEITWNSITGKPSTFPPSSHTHKKSEITDFPTSMPANGGNADTVDGKHASDFPLKSQGIGGNAIVWNGSNLNDLPIGVYTTKATGVPEVSTWHMVMCMYNDVGASKLQIAMSQGHSGGANDRRGRTYVRSCVQGTWSSWSPMDGVSLGYSDARGDGNKQPTWYVTKKRTGMTLELNSGTDKGMPSNHLYHVITTLPWHDTTGGVIQTATNIDTGQQYIRNRVNDTTWSEWKSLGGGSLSDKTYVKATRTVENTGNPNSNLDVINYSNSKGGVCKIAQYGGARMQIIVDGVMVLDGTNSNTSDNHPFVTGSSLSSSYGELPTYPFKNNVKVVDRSSNSGVRIYTAHFYVNA